tara:strand:- start:183 stop:599 length:417 start_codon:yes stop_codon:yes gene_type:complete
MRIVVIINDSNLSGDDVMIEAENVEYAVRSLNEIAGTTQSDRMKKFMQSKRDDMKKFTSALYGWDVDSKGNLKPNWKEQDIITGMKSMREAGKSFSEIATLLKTMNVKGKKGGDCSPNFVKRAISNPFHENTKKFERK